MKAGTLILAFSVSALLWALLFLLIASVPAINLLIDLLLQTEE